MTDAEILAALDNWQVLALTAWAEARQIPRNDPHDHSPVEELIAVMCAARNRLPDYQRWRATEASYKAICLAPNQFSCWTPGSGSNHDRLMQMAARLVDGIVPLDPLLRECLHLAAGVMSGAIMDRTGGANSYWAPAAMKPPGRVPVWAEWLPRLEIGDQVFVSVSEKSA